MAELVARGTQPDQEWRRTFPSEPITLGRTKESIWDVPWDNQISRRHVELTWRDGKLKVKRLPTGRNDVFFAGQANDEFTLSPGEQFAIGQTTFCLEEEVRTSSEPPTPAAELTCSAQELQQVTYDDASERIEVLAALPGVIRFAPSEGELENRVVDVLLRGIPRAEAAAIIRMEPAGSTGQPGVAVRCVKSRMSGAPALQPSRRLAADAINRRRQSVIHLWHPGAAEEFSVDPSFNWALCVPLADEAGSGWGLYVAGRLTLTNVGSGAAPEQDVLKTDLKFTELVAEIYAALRQVLDLQRRQALLSRFLSRPVLTALAGQDMDEVLKPRETEITVLFCDLRGSCRIAEEGRHELIPLWNRVSEALNIMASRIIDHDGVIGDFQGDAAMGFWGWPLPADDAVERAARAALTIRRRFARAAQDASHPLAGFACGIGIATGPAVAGRLGTLDQFKVDVFGPTVNLASRLESMTKMFRVPILLDETSAQRLKRADEGQWARCRRLARVRPYGMANTVLSVSELLPPAVEPGALAERDRKDYEAALDAFQDGRWADSVSLLQRLPGDGPAQFLRAYMDRHQRKPPTAWSKEEEKGVVTLESK
jgi:adenylate cyclase